MSHSTSAGIAMLLAVLVFAAMQAFRSNLGSSQAATVLGGFAGSNGFLFLLTVTAQFAWALIRIS